MPVVQGICPKCDKTVTVHFDSRSEHSWFDCSCEYWNRTELRTNRGTMIDPPIVHDNDNPYWEPEQDWDD